jgi:hypothetical protein
VRGLHRKEKHDGISLRTPQGKIRVYIKDDRIEIVHETDNPNEGMILSARAGNWFYVRAVDRWQLRKEQ